MSLQIALGRIQLKPSTFRLRFAWHTLFAYRQAKHAPGNVYVSLHGEKPYTYWSLSVWRSSEAMRDFSRSGAHARAMKLAARLADRIDFCHWEADAIPTWEEALQIYQRKNGGGDDKGR